MRAPTLHTLMGLCRLFCLGRFFFFFFFFSLIFCQIYGDEVLLPWDYTHYYTNPVTPAKYPKASTGTHANPAEHFVFYTSLADLEDPTLDSAHFRAGFTRIAPWWPWMRMGQSGVSGYVLGRMFSRKCKRGLDDIPSKLREYVERHHPDFFVAPTDWDDGQPVGSLEAYASQIAPEVQE
eukprot:TRINITY_DN216_c0_g2_i3.p2 TRINITY_DN216_c0_g2~~TRINITY_DN216_c0_g2_i3.p2  ORF type:complete len:179 (+),score=25.31 TRINITY_DN216_c0_g2_i3:551-1087(+)